MGSPAVVMRPIESADASAVGRFLHSRLNSRVSSEAWARVVTPPWQDRAPNHGFMLLSDGEIVGAYLAVYSERSSPKGPTPVCNLAAFCVLEDHRAQGLRLIRALLAQKQYDFTDFSPSGSVVALNERLGFRRLDTATRLAANLPRPPRRGTRVTEDPATLERVLRGRDAEVYRDHRDAAAARHLLVERDGRHGYLVFRRDRRKGLPLFATPLYVGGDSDCLSAAWPGVASHLLLKHGLPATLAERRILGFLPGPGLDLRNPRAKMIRGERLDAEAIDYLYSELTLVQW